MKFRQQLYLNSIEELNNAPHGWDTDIVPLTGQAAPVQLDMSSNENVQLMRVRLDCATLQRGSTPRDTHTFSMLMEQRDQHNFRGRSIDRNSLIIFPEDRELHAVSSAGVTLCNITVSDNSLHQALCNLELPANAMDGLAESVGITDPMRQRLLRQCENLSRFLLSCDDHAHSPELSLAAEEELITALLQSLVTMARTGRPVAPNKRYRHTRLALDYLQAHTRQPIAVGQLAEAVGTSRRTLETGFRQVLDLSPGEYIRLSRLQGCRRQLLRQCGDRRASVSETASQWGFWHLGQFAADYRREFGELPSQTLRA